MDFTSLVSHCFLWEVCWLSVPFSGISDELTTSHDLLSSVTWSTVVSSVPTLLPDTKICMPLSASLFAAVAAFLACCILCRNSATVSRGFFSGFEAVGGSSDAAFLANVDSFLLYVCRWGLLRSNFVAGFCNVVEDDEEEDDITSAERGRPTEVGFFM